MGFTTHLPEKIVVSEGGAKRSSSEGKAAFGLLLHDNLPFPDQMLTRVAELAGRGAEIYGAKNWQTGDSEFVEARKHSALRHMHQWVTGETDEDHAAAAIINIIFCESLQTLAKKEE